MTDLVDIFRAAADLELAVARLYGVFVKKFPEDSDLWWKLQQEEMNHASLLKSAMDFPGSLQKDLQDLTDLDVQGFEDLTVDVKAHAEEFKKGEKTREDALDLAIELEENAGEKHLQDFMKSGPDSTIGNLFKLLNGDDLDHAERLHEYKAGLS